jgi:uncharacterized membrane protein
VKSGLVLRKKIHGTIQIFFVSATYMVAVFMSLTEQEWRDGQTAVGLIGILIIETVAASVGYLCSRIFVRSRP